jgi:hypothetical protein
MKKLPFKVHTKEVAIELARCLLWAEFMNGPAGEYKDRARKAYSALAEFELFAFDYTTTTPEATEQAALALHKGA